MCDFLLEPLNHNDDREVLFLFETRRHPVTCAFLFGKPPTDLKSHKDWLRANIALKRLIYLLKLDGEPIGYSQAYGFRQADKTLEAGFVIRPVLHGRGYGKVMVRMFMEVLAEKFSGWKVLLKVKENNGVALRLYDTTGFVRTSIKDGVVTMEKQL